MEIMIVWYNHFKYSFKRKKVVYEKQLWKNIWLGEFNLLFEEFVPNLVEMQKGMKEETVIASLPESIKSEIKDMDFNEAGRDPEI